MPKNMTVRNIDDEVYSRLRQRAARHGRSTEAEVREILKTATAAEVSRDEVWRKIDEFRESLKGRPFTPSEVLVREGRDER